MPNMENYEDIVRILKIEPGKVPEVIEVENRLSVYQELVGGPIEALTLSDSVCMIVNENGKLEGLTPNRHFGDDILVGTVLIIGRKDEFLVSLAPDDLAEYESRFHELEDISPSVLDILLPGDIGFWI